MLKALYILFPWQTCSIRYTISTSLGSIQRYAIINARKLLVHISTTIYSHACTHFYSWVNWSNVEWKTIAQGFNITAENWGRSCGLMDTVCWTLVCLQVNLGHYMRTLFFDIMQAEDVLFICLLSSKPETRTTSRKWREAAMQVSKILLSLWVWYHCICFW